MLGYTEDQSGRLWIVDNYGLIKSDTLWDNFTRYYFPDIINIELNQMSLNQIPVITWKNNKLIFGIKSRLFVYDIEQNAFYEIQIPKIKTLLQFPYIRTILEDIEGRIIFNCNGRVYRLSQDFHLDILWESPVREKLEITKLLLDNSNNLWVGINAGGLYKLNLNTPAFNYRKYDMNFLYDIFTYNLNFEKEKLPKNWNHIGRQRSLLVNYNRTNY